MTHENDADGYDAASMGSTQGTLRYGIESDFDHLERDYLLNRDLSQTNPQITAIDSFQSIGRDHFPSSQSKVGRGSPAALRNRLILIL